MQRKMLFFRFGFSIYKLKTVLDYFILFFLLLCVDWAVIRSHSLQFSYWFICINGFIKRHTVVTSEASFLPRDGRNHTQYSLHLPMEGWPGWVGLDK